MTKRLKKIPLLFYRTKAGSEPVRDWVKSLPESDRHAIGLDLMRVQFGWPVGMPLCRALDGGLWEVRTTLPDAEKRESCSSFTTVAWVSSTASSKGRRRHHRPNSSSPANA